LIGDDREVNLKRKAVLRGFFSQLSVQGGGEETLFKKEEGLTNVCGKKGWEEQLAHE